MIKVDLAGIFNLEPEILLPLGEEIRLGIERYCKEIFLILKFSASKWNKHNFFSPVQSIILNINISEAPTTVSFYLISSEKKTSLEKWIFLPFQPFPSNSQQTGRQLRFRKWKIFAFILIKKYRLERNRQWKESAFPAESLLIIYITYTLLYITTLAGASLGINHINWVS